MAREIRCLTMLSLLKPNPAPKRRFVFMARHEKTAVHRRVGRDLGRAARTRDSGLSPSFGSADFQSARWRMRIRRNKNPLSQFLFPVKENSDADFLLVDRRRAHAEAAICAIVRVNDTRVRHADRGVLQHAPRVKTVVVQLERPLA